jgi:hypothetical protein
MRIASFTLVGAFAASLAAPLGAQSLAASPNVYDVAAGIGDLTSVSFSYLRMANAGTSEKLRFGLGARATLMVGELKMLPVTGNRPVPFTVHDTLTISVAPVVLNLVAHADWTFTEKLTAGVNLDIFGITTGGSRTGTYKENQSATPEDVNAKPPGTNISGFGLSDDRGLVVTELYAGWKLSEKYTLRGGLSRQRVQYNTDLAMSSFTSEFEKYNHLAFVGLRITP